MPLTAFPTLHMVYFHCRDGTSSPIKKLLKSKPHLQRLLAKTKLHMRMKGNR